jgi:protein TonB
VQQGLEGHVVLEFTITAQGTTTDISVVESSSPLFEQPAITALGRWRYNPQTVDGQAVERTGIHTMISFVLDRDEPAPAPTPTPAQPVAVRPESEQD